MEEFVGQVLDIEAVIQKMSLEEKARLVGGATFFGMAGIERLGIRRIQLLDGGTGINFEQLFGDMLDVEDLERKNGKVGSESLVRVIEYFFEPDKLHEEDLFLYSKIKRLLLKRVNPKEEDDKKNQAELAYSPGCYPPGILLGATWNPQVVELVGEALGIDASFFGVDILLGSPNVNIHRDPLNGRLFEGYSEDPCLVSMLAPEMVKGVQSYGVAANVKHFAANNQETYRLGIDEHIARRALEEIYFPGFRACVAGNVWTVMSAYNKINGVACTENEWLLRKKLRDEWGFSGMVLSDWGAVYHPVRAIRAGNNLAMPGPVDNKPVINGVKNGELAEEDLDDAVRRILGVINQITEHKASYDDIAKRLKGQLKQEPLSIPQNGVFNLARDFTDDVAYMAAAEGIVLLENDGTLPLEMNARVAVMGSPFVDNCGQKKSGDLLVECGNGSAGINTDRVGSLSKSLSAYCGNILDCDDETVDTILYIVRIGGMEGNDRKNLLIDDTDLCAINKLIEENKLRRNKKRLILVLNTSGPVELTGIDKNGLSAILAVFLPGMGGCDALADILFGELSPSGKLPVTFPKKYEDTPTCLNFPGDGYYTEYGEGIFVGYRYYDKKKIVPLYRFGYGLSYTTFLCKLKKVTVEDRQLHVYVTAKNTGSMTGSEVIQIYVGDPYSTLVKPVKELKAFKKVQLSPDEEKELCLSIQLDAMASFDVCLDCWTLEEGYYDIYAATSSGNEDIFGYERIYLDVASPYRYGMKSTIKTVCENAELKTILYEIWNELALDEGILNSNYQYTASKTIEEIISGMDEDVVSKISAQFTERAKAVKKP
ncbi:MAG: glycoside hydrolase family 3 C-terminal domain-containing protein [Clostridium sp.]|nr:glycoside hydrolase family 3 C-terminal domain-containing protein [Clostridium sp.]MCM1398179.1 glycoside hydrolase family 3 C-terminal domain-containing protein [Clostridium sp.]MCM1460990.1 glycoside hydrolase family 3 C-terminal domain-containing protein [Bacteroides sp.]